MSQLHFVERTVPSRLTPTNPVREVRLVDDHITGHGIYSRDPACYGNCDHDTNHKDQDFGDAAKEKLNNAGRAIKHTAEKIGDKAGELKDKTKQKIQEGVDAIKGN